MFQIIPCRMSEISWKFTENPFNHFSVMLVTDTDSPENVGEKILG